MCENSFTTSSPLFSPVSCGFHLTHEKENMLDVSCFSGYSSQHGYLTSGRNLTSGMLPICSIALCESMKTAFASEEVQLVVVLLTNAEACVDACVGYIGRSNVCCCPSVPHCCDMNCIFGANDLIFSETNPCMPWLNIWIAYEDVLHICWDFVVCILGKRTQLRFWSVLCTSVPVFAGKLFFSMKMHGTQSLITSVKVGHARVSSEEADLLNVFFYILLLHKCVG